MPMSIRTRRVTAFIVFVALMPMGCGAPYMRGSSDSSTDEQEMAVSGPFAPVFTKRSSSPAPGFASKSASLAPQESSIPIAMNSLVLSQDKVYQQASFDDVGRDPQKAPTGKRIVVYTGNYQIVVTEIDATISMVKKIAEDTAGWIDAIEASTVTLRVPAARYDEAIERIEALGRVVHRSLRAADVTDDYVDLEARLKNAKAVRERLNALLARAEDVKAALEVEKELFRVGEEIEQIEAKLEILKNRVAYSTITVTFETVERSPLPPSTQLPFPWLRELDPRRLTRTY